MIRRRVRIIHLRHSVEYGVVVQNDNSRVHKNTITSQNKVPITKSFLNRTALVAGFRLKKKWKGQTE